MINVFDNALEPHVAELIDMQLRDVSWKYNYDSVKNGKNKHCHNTLVDTIHKSVMTMAMVTLFLSGILLKNTNHNLRWNVYI